MWERSPEVVVKDLSSVPPPGQGGPRPLPYRRMPPSPSPHVAMAAGEGLLLVPICHLNTKDVMPCRSHLLSLPVFGVRN